MWNKCFSDLFEFYPPHPSPLVDTNIADYRIYESFYLYAVHKVCRTNYPAPGRSEHPVPQGLGCVREGGVRNKQGQGHGVRHIFIGDMGLLREK